MITYGLVSHAKSTFLTCRVGNKESPGMLHQEGDGMALACHYDNSLTEHFPQWLQTCSSLGEFALVTARSF